MLFDSKLRLIEVVVFEQAENSVCNQLIDISSSAREIFGMAHDKPSFEYQMKTIHRKTSDGTSSSSTGGGEISFVMLVN